MFDAYVRLPAKAPGKLALQTWLEQRYAGDVAPFNADWALSLADTVVPGEIRP